MKTFTSLCLLIILLAATAQAQYCMLPGRTHYGSLQPGIKNFKLNTINRTSAPIENPLSSPPIKVTTDSTNLQRGQTYTVTIVHTRDSVSFPTSRNNIRVWIDYNNDKDFTDAGETVISADLQTYGTYTGTFTVPATAPLGTVRLRVTAKMSADAGHTLPTSCDEPKDPLDYHGEMEDYHVKITPATNVSNIAANDMQIAVYPNPASDNVAVIIDSKNNQNLTIALYDVTGKQITNLLQEPVQTAARYDFNLGSYNLANGIYFIKATSAGKQSFQKLMIAK